MKRLVVVVVLSLCALVFAVPAAQASPTSATGCTVEHVSGAECQGPDVDPAANACEIYTWVDNASCVLTVTDGVASNTSGTLVANAENQDANWHAEFQLAIRDVGTGQVLYSTGDSLTVPITQQPVVPAASLGFGNVLSESGGGEVVCEVSGTHNPAGAAMSAIAASAGIQGLFNNSFRCVVD
jgi:hypothetical protein